MGENSKIEWTNNTFNPWVGCQKVSPACEHCYAENWAKRTGSGNLWRGERRRTSEANWKLPHKWNRQAAKDGTRPRVFCASLADVFENHPDLPRWRSDLFNVINETPCLDWLLLTKRPENIQRLWPFDFYSFSNPWDNIWIGTTVENQETADKRIPELLQIPAKVRFLSMEPLLGPVNLGLSLGALNWVIAGGESGQGARPSHPDWFRSIRDECEAAHVPFHFKQWGEWVIKSEKPKGITVGPGGYGVISKNGEWFPRTTGWNGRDIDPDTSEAYMVWAGKKKAGRLLDGRTWDDLPNLKQAA